MIVDVIMPKLGESITEGTIIEWKKEIGDSIKQDETILEISTDKVDSEVPSPSAGNLIEVLYKPNDVVPVGEVIARIGTEGESSIASNDSQDTSTNQDTPILDSIEEEIKPLPVQKEEAVKAKTKDNKSSSFKFYSPLVKSIAKIESKL